MTNTGPLLGTSLAIGAVAFLDGCGAAYAAHAEAGALVLQWGDALAVFTRGLAEVVTPLAVAAVTGLVARFAGPARVLITTALVERLVANATAYALNAVAGAARGRTLTIPIGSAVVA